MILIIAQIMPMPHGPEGPFGIYLLIAFSYWYIFLLLGLCLAGLTIWAKTWAPGWRICSGVGAAFFLFPMMLFAIGGIYNSKPLRQWRNERREKAHTWTLKKQRTFENVALPANTKIHFSPYFEMKNKQKGSFFYGDITSVELPHPTSIGGITLKDTVYSKLNIWYGTLKGKQIIEGLPCNGKIIFEFSAQGGISLKDCSLYKQHTVFGQTLPANTNVYLGAWDWTFQLPSGKLMTIDIDQDQGKIVGTSDDPDYHPSMYLPSYLLKDDSE